MYKYDLHVHTSEVSQCGKVGARDVVNLYKQAGYAGIVITDHYFKEYFEGMKLQNWNDKIDRYLEGYKAARDEGMKVGLNVMLGMELRFYDCINDYLIFGIDEDFLREYPELYNYNLRQFRSFIDGANKEILIYQAHPFRTGMTIQNPVYLHGVEVYNGNPRHNSRNSLARLFADENNLKVISGSDFHQVMDLARGGIMAEDKINDMKELVRLFKDGIGFELITADNIDKQQAICY